MRTLLFGGDHGRQQVQTRMQRSSDGRSLCGGGGRAGGFGDVGGSESRRFKSGSEMTGAVRRPRTGDRLDLRGRDSQSQQSPLTAGDGVAARETRVERTELNGDARGRRRERRGLWTVIGAFAICPCHLPVTLGLLGVALGGSAVGIFVRNNVVLAGALVTIVWAALTWRGIWLLRNGRSCPAPSATQSGERPGLASLRRRR